MKTYKIENSNIPSYVKRNNNRVLQIIAISIVIMSILMFLMTLQKGAPPELTYYILFSLLFTSFLVGLIYINNKKLTRAIAENLQITVDDNSITRIINLESETSLNFLHKMAYDRAKHVSGGYYAKIEFENIESISKKNGDLWIKATDSNSLTSKNILLVPRELEHFEELEKEISHKRK